jgi:hypothetical protein
MAEQAKATVKVKQMDGGRKLETSKEKQGQQVVPAL